MTEPAPPLWPPTPRVATAVPEPPAQASFPAGKPAPGHSPDWLLRNTPEVLAAIGRDLDAEPDPARAMPKITTLVGRWASAEGGRPVTAADRAALAQAVYDRLYALGPLTGYMNDPAVENVDVNGCDEVWVTYASGERIRGLPAAVTDDELVSMVRTWAARGGQTTRDFSAATPLVNVALTSGARLTATMSVTPRPCVSLRRHGQVDVTLDRLIELGTIDATIAGFLAAAVRARCNVIITGGVAAGKTTLLRALASEIPPSERVATLESEYELFLHRLGSHPDVIAFEARQPNSEGAGEITLHDLIAHALRHNPKRILVGEVRTGEIMPMLEAMNSGQEGSMCTLHANSPAEVFDRILILGLRGGLALAERAIHILVGMAVDLIVHIRQATDGEHAVRYVSEILEVMPPADADRPAINRLFLPDPVTGRAMPATSPSQTMVSRLYQSGFDSAGLGHPRAQAGRAWS
jgi:Flp pilus assembly CpaF family ATPase